MKVTLWMYLLLFCFLLTSVESINGKEKVHEINLRVEWNDENRPISINGVDLVESFIISGIQYDNPHDSHEIMASYIDIPLKNVKEDKKSNYIVVDNNSIKILEGESTIKRDLGLQEARANIHVVGYETEKSLSFGPTVQESYYKMGLEPVIRIIFPLETIDKETGILHPIIECCFRLNEIESTFAVMANDEINSLLNGISFSALEYGETSNQAIKKYYAIVTSKKLGNEASVINTWQMEKGYNSEIHYVEDILSSSEFRVGSVYSGSRLVDEASSIRAYLKNLYDNRKGSQFYILLLGNEEIGVPYRKFRNSALTSNEYYEVFSGTNFIPSDGYYSDLITEFNVEKQKCGYYAVKTDFRSFSPIVPCGRLLTGERSEVNNYCRKMFIYEGNPGLGDDSYLGNVLITQHNENFKDYKVTDLGSINLKTIFFQGTDLHAFQPNTPSGGDIISSMGNIGLATMRGHGNPNSIACSGYNAWGSTWRYIQTVSNLLPSEVFNTSDPDYQKEDKNGLDEIDNFGKPFVFHSIGCSTIPFDNITDENGKIFNQKYNIGSSFTTRGLNGGVAFIGNTRDSFHSSGIAIENAFMGSLSRDMSLGEYVCELRKKTSDASGQYMLNLIGDPTLHLWLGLPDRMNPTIGFMGNRVYLSLRNLYDTEVVVYNGRNKVEIDLNITGDNTGYFEFNSNINEYDFGCAGTDYLLALWKNGFLPEFYLVADNKLLRGIEKRYILRDLKMGKASVTHACNYNVRDNGYLRLHCVGMFRSNNGLLVGNNGSVEIFSEVSVSCENDSIKSGGLLEAKAPKIVIGEGFSVEKGGCVRLTVE